MGDKIYHPNVLTPDQIIAKLSSVFESGVGGDLFFYDSTTSTHIEHGIEYEIRKCPALLLKPVMPTPHFSASPPKGKPDPFEPPYSKDLLVGELHGENDSKYIIMDLTRVTKFSVVKHHFLLITKEYLPQSTPPTPEDLIAVYSLITAASRAGNPFFGFFNCGVKSGASQGHKHLQLFPLSSPDGPPIEVLASRTNLENDSKPFALPGVPWAHYVRRFPPHFASSSTPTEELYETLTEAFMSLLDLSIVSIRHDNENEHETGALNYNLLITKSHMHIIPRSHDKHVLGQSGDAVSVNSVGFAGLLLVKSDAESEAVTMEGVQNILR
ncbi:uncharacterized protein EI90DRAFT_2919014 [Cantharellus anzutake]|uniref:uncharacterized protein n=1 Tax=Cantharellus anzutake TaxID=1750568 RepID=UPI0019036B9C|nr:uncharacterized protein EI90DRAFT_2919014 [Cantharellus anzutake]KAF8332059.1 hypothetical protein EI90DRAFT_2919014 [Cantharellus anzutake]